MTPGRSADKRPFARLAVGPWRPRRSSFPPPCCWNVCPRMPTRRPAACRTRRSTCRQRPRIRRPPRSPAAASGASKASSSMSGAYKRRSRDTPAARPEPPITRGQHRHDRHAKSVQITFDPQQVSLRPADADPVLGRPWTRPSLNYQGPDHGSQYRSDDLRRRTTTSSRTATAYIAQLEQAKSFPAPIVTRVDELAGFYPAEAYHQDFLERHPDHPYIRAWDMPKVEALRRLFPESYTATPSLAQGPGAGS